MSGEAQEAEGKFKAHSGQKAPAQNRERSRTRTWVGVGGGEKGWGVSSSTLPVDRVVP